VRAISGLWRWRHNPLRRGTDLAEAWVALVTLLLILVVAPLAGAAVGGAAQDALQRSVKEQQASRHAVTATVIRELASPPIDPDGVGADGRGNRSSVLAKWTGPDGSVHRDEAGTGLPHAEPGDRFTLWTDGRGEQAVRPLDAGTATTHAVLAGIGAAVMAAALAEGGRRLLVRELLRRRYARWDQAWEQAGPDWGRTGTGS
jgi:hypothetical protein